MRSSFIRCCLLTVATIWQLFAFAQQKNKEILDIEDVAALVRRDPFHASDTAHLNFIADSTAKENNLEKTEYTRLFVFIRKGELKGSATKSYYEIAAPVFTAYKTPGARAYFKFYYGESLFNSKEFSQAMELMLEAVSEFESIGYEKIPVLDIPLYLLSTHYYVFNNYRKAIEFGTLANKYRSKILTGIQNTVGMAYQKLTQYDSAIISFQQMMAIAQEKNSDVWYAIASGNLGRTYCLKGNFEDGIPLLRNDVRLGKKGAPVNSGLSSVYIAEAFINQKIPDSALYYLTLAKDIVDEAGLWGNNQFYIHRFCYYYYEQMANYYKLVGNYTQAYIYLDTAKLNKDRYDRQFDWQFVTSVEKRITGLKYQQSIDLLAVQRKNEQLKNIILFVMLGGVLIIATLLLYGQKLKRQRERQLAAEKEANLLLKKENAEQQLENAKHQLNELLLKFQERTSLKDNPEASLQQVAGENDALTKGQSEKVLQQLAGASLLTNQDWQLFQQRFEKVYEGFFVNLSREVPGITPAEERMLALLKLKVSNRHMAQMLGISPESVSTAKYRLRKKLQVHNQEHLLEQPDDQNPSSLA